MNYRVVSLEIVERVLADGRWSLDMADARAFDVDPRWWFGKDDRIPWLVYIRLWISPASRSVRRDAVRLTNAPSSMLDPDACGFTVCSPKFAARPIGTEGEEWDVSKALVVESLDYVDVLEHVEARLAEYEHVPTPEDVFGADTWESFTKSWLTDADEV